MAYSLLGILKGKADLAITDRQVLVLIHTKVFHHTIEQTALYMDTSIMTITREYRLMETEGVFAEAERLTDDYEMSGKIVASASVQQVRVDASKGNVEVDLGALIDSTLKATTPKKPRKAVTAKAPPKRKSNQESPLEVSCSEWNVRHLISYMEILWCEQKWSTPFPKTGAKERALAKKFLEAYQHDAKKIVDYMFADWVALSQSCNITGLPNLSILWGFRNSIVPRAMGDVGASAGKTWGSTHDKAQERDDGDEIGW